MNHNVTRHPIMPAWMMPSTGFRVHQSAIQSGTRITNEMPMLQSQIRSSQRGTVKMLIVALLALCWPSFAQAQGTLSPVAQQVFLDASGNPLNNGKICTYAAGTLNQQATYYDQDLAVAHQNANPIRTNSAGRPTTGGVYLSATSYKFIVLTAGTDATCNTGTPVYTQDGIGAVPATAVGLDVPSQTAGVALAAGDVVYLSDGSGGLIAGRWYKADADFTYASTTPWIGMVPTAIASGATGSIRVGGRMTGLSGLTAGTKYYISATAGALTSTAPANSRTIGQADTTTSLVMDANPAPPTVQTSAISTADGRLTGTTAVPVTSADVTGTASIFYTPYVGNRIALYDGSATWNIRTFTEITIALMCTASKPYDVFIVDAGAGVQPTAETLVWTNATTRATALTLQNGVLVKTGATTRRYVGSFYCNSSGNQTDDSYAKRNIWNYYNRQPRPMRVLETGDWTYTTATLRQANANAANQLEVMIGWPEVPVEVDVSVNASNGTTSIDLRVAIGQDSTTTQATGSFMGAQSTLGATLGGARVNMRASFRTITAVGRYLFVWLEYSGASGTTTWRGSEGNAGIFGMVWG